MDCGRRAWMADIRRLELEMALRKAQLDLTVIRQRLAKSRAQSGEGLSIRP